MGLGVHAVVAAPVAMACKTIQVVVHQKMLVTSPLRMWTIPRTKCAKRYSPYIAHYRAKVDAQRHREMMYLTNSPHRTIS